MALLREGSLSPCALISYNFTSSGPIFIVWVYLFSLIYFNNVCVRERERESFINNGHTYTWVGGPPMALLREG